MKLLSPRHATMLGAVALAGMAFFSWPACSECDNGVLVDGVCEGRCDPSTCLENNACVENRCVLKCTSHNECYSPARGQSRLQECTSQKSDTVPADGDPNKGLGEGPAVLVCTDSDKAPNDGLLCPFGTECDTSFACPDGTSCTDGTGSDGHCTAAECKPMQCITKGEADAEAYCSTVDCKADTDCGPGMYCGVEEVPNKICGTDKGDTDPCIDPSAFTADGATYQEGAVALVRNVCLKREPCAPCDGPTDCSLAPDLQCVNINGFQACAKTCGADGDCNDDFTCVSNFCIPRSGQCKPPATNNFCFNCLNDLDCGPAGPDNSVACIEASSGQRACFDLSFPDACTVDGDCPAGPSGKHGECLDEGEGLSPSDGAYHRCYLPYFPAPNKFQCWQAK